jgi:mxaA protein
MKNLIIKFVLVATLNVSLLLAVTAAVAAEALAQNVAAKIVQLSNPLQNNSIQIGTVLARSVSIEVNAPYTLLKTALPMKGQVRHDIELSAITVEAVLGDKKNVYHIALQYQVFANATKPTVMHLPAENFTFSGTAEEVSVQLPTWGFWFSPLVPENIANAEQNLQPQYKPTLLDLSRHHIKFWLLLVLGVIGLLGLIYINADLRQLPFMNGAFAEAQRKLKRLVKTQAGKSPVEASVVEKQALLTMHQAFNQTHGENLFAKDIAVFLTAHPQFNRLKTEIEQFFAHANASLFASQIHDQQRFMQTLLALSKSLRDCERGV